MPKEEKESECGCCGPEMPSGCCQPPHHMGFGIVKMLLLALIVVGGIYIIVNGYKAPDINMTTTPSIYVSSTPPEHSIATSATVTSYVAPDLLVIQLGAQSEAATANQSQEDNAAAMAKVKAAIKALGVPDEKVKTSYYSVDVVQKSHYTCKNYTWGSDCSYDYVITGYKTTQTLTISLEGDRMSLGGKVLDSAVAAGATDIGYVSFTLKSETQEKLQMELLQNASADAKTRAQKIATGMGVSLGKPLSASESVYYQPYYSNYKSYEAMAAPAPSGGAGTDLSSGQLQVSATVSASFAIQ